MLHSQTVILDNKKISTGYFLLQLESSRIAKNPSPGQFLHIKCSSKNNPLLRRPFSIHRVIDKKIEILYKVVGKGTLCLSQRKKGEKLDCIGPLGKGFKFSKTENRHSGIPHVVSQKPKTESILIAGGIGIAPLFFLAERIKELPITPARNRQAGGNYQLPIKIFLGAKTKKEILCAGKLKNLGAKLHIATEDGSLGYKGLISNLLKKKLSTINHQLSTSIYACGPQGMLKEVALISKKHKIPCQVSFEQFMGCGIGICNACVIKTKHGYRRVCKDGPVFDAEEIDWEKI